MGKQGVKIEIMDTTLRDGEQTSGVSFVPHEKLMIARLLLEDLKVDRVEVASARVSEGEFEAVKMICDWAARRNLLQKVEVLGFVDGHTSVDWIQRTGCRVINLLCKGSLKHCTQQLKKTPEEHIADIINVVHYADEQDIGVNVYLEDWSNGMKDSPEYVFQLMDGLKQTSIRRYMLPDTLGILNPLQVIEYMRKMKKRYPNTHFDFHAHNDYDLAVSNVLAAVLSGVRGLHTTINGLGERAGNAPLSSVQAILKDHFNAMTNIDESRLNDVSRVVESYSGIVIPANKPIVGENVFTQVAGVHADGDNKNNLYCNDLLPERFGREREYALGKTSGKANIRKNLEDLGLELDEDAMRKVTERIIELGDKKELVTQEDLPYIVSDVLKHGAIGENIPVSIIVDELPTLYFHKIDRLIGTARSNKVSVALGFQELPQLEADYGKVGMQKIITTVGNVVSGSARSKETLEWLSSDIFGKVVQLKKGVTIDRDKTSINLNENMDSLVPASKISDMPTGWICGQTARDFVATKTGMNGSMNIQESDEFKTSKFYCKTDFNMADIKKEESEYMPLPKFYTFKSRDERERILYKNFVQVGEDVKAMIAEIFNKKNAK